VTATVHVTRAALGSIASKSVFCLSGRTTSQDDHLYGFRSRLSLRRHAVSGTDVTDDPESPLRSKRPYGARHILQNFQRRMHFSR
jgi:hypothetical protein